MDNYNEDIKTRKTRFKQRKSKLTSWVLREVSSLESFTANSKVYNTADSKVFTHSLLAKSVLLLTVVYFLYLGGVSGIGTAEHIAENFKHTYKAPIMQTTTRK
ncbi:Uncharacterized protein Rs2_24540 [Raphanus sativus]|nr:Uncharacterized protein Rs2_24540 [Raphanus sativus]